MRSMFSPFSFVFMRRTKKIGQAFAGAKKPHKWRMKPGAVVTTLAVLGAVTYLLCFLMFRVRPIVEAVMKAHLNKSATEIIHRAANEVFAEEEISYRDIVEISKDDNQKITAISVDFAAMNRIKADLTLKILNSSAFSNQSQISVPLGNLLGNEFFSGIGPRIRMKVVPYNIVKVDFRDQFNAMGINQTAHEIYLDIDAKVSAILPGMKCSTNVKTSMMVAHTVIVGDVPESYTVVNEMEGRMEDYILDVIP